MASGISLWQSAFVQLSKDEPKLARGFESLDQTDLKHSDKLIKQVMLTIEERQQALDNRRWAFRLRGRVLVVRDCLNTVLKGVKAVQEIGSALASLEPVYAGIPWACVNVVLNVR